MVESAGWWGMRRQRAATATSWQPLALAMITLLAFTITTGYTATIKVYPGDSIQDALDRVSPGDTIVLQNGEYFEDVKTKVDGEPNKRITVRGTGGTSNRKNVILHGAGKITRIFQVRHDYYTIEDFTIDGKTLDNPNDEDYRSTFRDKLLYALASRAPTMRAGGYESALDGLIVRNMVLKNAGGECVRLRYYVTYAVVHDNEILNCGIYDYVFDDGGKNGEGIYVGTSSTQWGDGNNYSDGPDKCRGNVIRGNIIETNGSEGIDVKEGSIDTLVAGNYIYVQLDSKSGGIDSRADKTTIRDNYIEDADGAGVRLGGHKVDGHQYGVDNLVYGNILRDCREYGVKIMEFPQSIICGNTIYLPPGSRDGDYGYTGGEYVDNYDARADCPPLPSPPTPSPTKH